MRRTRLTTQGLTEGAIQAALVALFAVVSRYVPITVLVTTFLMPLPLTVLVIRRGLRPAVLAALVSAVLAGVLTGNVLTGLGILVAVAPFGIVVGLGARRGWSAPRILAAAILASGASVVANGLLLLAFLRINPIQEYALTIVMMREQMEATLAFYTRLGVGEQTLETFRRTMFPLLDLLPKLTLFVFVSSAVMSAWMNYEIARPILRRVGHPLPALPPASSWRLPGFVLWLLPLAYLLSALGQQQVVTLSDRLRGTLPSAPLPVSADLGLSLFTLVQTAFQLQGVLVGWVFLSRYRMHRLLRLFIIGSLVFNPIFGYLFLLLGLVDSVFPLRERLGARFSAAGAAT
jgi:uncharacterized protein YybS (DUF2232 family)